VARTRIQPAVAALSREPSNCRCVHIGDAVIQCLAAMTRRSEMQRRPLIRSATNGGDRAANAGEVNLAVDEFELCRGVPSGLPRQGFSLPWRERRAKRLLVVVDGEVSARTARSSARTLLEQERFGSVGWSLST
jgi:hypothetical protein